MDLVKIIFGWAPFYPQIRNFQHLLEAIFAVAKYGYPARDLTVIGVTGTDGKTTTTHLIGAILSEAGCRTAIVSTVGGFFDGREVDTGFHVTTPDARYIQPLLVRIRDSGITHVVLEVTSHGLDQHRVFGCNFKIGVLTNITHEHLDYHKTWEKYRDAKAKLFRNVKIAVLNRDDGSFDYIKNVAHGARVISYSATKSATIVGKSVAVDVGGVEFLINEGKKKAPIKTLLFGKYNISNILAASGVGRALGISWNSIADAVSKFPGIPGRMEEISNKKGFRTIVDFAHTPNALESLLKTLRNSTAGKIIVVFGSAGLRDREKRKLMGKVSARLADFSVVTAEDPRTENVEAIIDEITRGIRQNAKVWDGQVDWRKSGRWCIRVAERGEAISFAIQKLAQKGDIVVICGKGHEKSMAYGKKEYPWSDREAVEVALAGGIKRVMVNN
ncbi:UDP-N-acetylmuramoyl-L-alanyl-D-glutamate--2,6-diaminopimelate ligase [Candidatus Microgenomates bacterium]|nr:UDP-N-acetylmuramoyl-L-alanyl-D-glutamate--2,6-diaminopimelate ligase [Candidatus Microgenomates bacterium]